MTSISGNSLIATPCCRAIYAKVRFSSMNFSASAYWTDGKRENSLMPNDGGLRKCECGKFFLINECINLEIDAGENPKYPLTVLESELLSVIQSSTSLEMELVARRAYWMYLNNEYRERYKLHRDAEEAAIEKKWSIDWGYKNPDTRTLIGKILNKFLHKKQLNAANASNKPFTFPIFIPTIVQIENMLRLIELIKLKPKNHIKEYPIELAELYRELGIFFESISLIQKMKKENQDRVSSLILDLSIQEKSAPIRYRL